jgi:DtxR family transcriptional regulator, Mn-dependent transcriptional regulator
MYELDDGSGPLRKKVVADRAGITLASVKHRLDSMADDGLVVMCGDRRVELTPAGRTAAVDVVRRHRILECLMAEVIHLELERVHDEAARWQDVVSDAATMRIATVLGFPSVSPFGMPIPGMPELRARAGGPPVSGPAHGAPRVPAVCLGREHQLTGRAVVRWIAESLQSDGDRMSVLDLAGIRPGATLDITRARSFGAGVEVVVDGRVRHLPSEIAGGVWVDRVTTPSGAGGSRE